MGLDMAKVLDDGDNLRVLPIIGKGSAQNLIDIMRLRNVDMGFVVSDAIEFVKTENAVPNIERQVQYIAKLFNNDIHIVACKQTTNIYDLEGKKIFSEQNLGYFSVRNLFNRLHISADVDFKTDDRGCLQEMLDGEADAWIVSAGKVAPIVRNIPNDAGKFHLVPVIGPFKTFIFPQLSLMLNIRTSSHLTRLYRCVYPVDGVQLARGYRALCQSGKIR
jgi:uncharacterized protein